MHKLLTIDDLITFCETQNFARFNSKESGYQICVQVPAKFEQAESADDELLLANTLVFHTGVNKNHSNVTESAAKKAIKDLAYKPVLANFCEIDGVRDFTSHDFEVDEDGNFIYYEKQVGCFTADKPYMKQDPDNEDRMNVFAKVAIPRHYTDAADIIERKAGTSCSVELAVNELSWDSNEKMLLLEDVTIMALTLLGKNPDNGEDVQPGMEGAHIQIEDFSVEKNSLTFNSTFINEIADAVADRIGKINTTERRNDAVMDFEEKIEETTVEETEVETTEEETATEEPVTEEETPEVVDEFEESEETDKEVEEKPAEEEADEKPVDEEAEESDEQTETFVDDSSPDEEEEDPVVDDDEQEPGYGKKTYSVNDMTFEVSLSDIQSAIFELVNSTYGESDNDCYAVEVYEGSKSVVMIGVWTNRMFKQNYKVRNGVYSLVGDRVPVKAVYVTADEEAELDRMRSNYSAISDKLAKYEEEPEKMAILNSDDYANIADSTEFAELKQQENHFDLTIDELKDKADAMLLAYAKSGKLNFAAREEKEEESKHDFFAFARVDRDTSFLDRVLKEKR